ncbi:MAG: macro domain-containing protein [Nitrososphaerota archaeon]
MSILEITINQTVLKLVIGDITDLSVDAIVNAANSSLRLGRGVAGAIRRKGGPEIQRECDKIISQRGAISTGSAVITTGGNLKARWVIHAVGPVYGEGEEDEKLKDATLNSLRLADQNGLTTIAFPAISTGYFGLPKKRCAEVMIPAAVSYIRRGTKLKQVVFCLFDEETFNVFKNVLEKLSTGP